MLEKLQKGLGTVKETAGRALETITLYPEIILVRRTIIDLIRHGHFDQCNGAAQDNLAFREYFIERVRSGGMDGELMEGLTAKDPIRKKKRPE